MSAPDETHVDALFRLDGKRALIVGGYGGIGSLICTLFAQAGATVAVAGRALERAEEVAAGVGAEAIAAQVDVSDRASVQALVDDVAGRLGGVDVLVNCAAIEVHGPAEEVDEETWHSAIEINLSGAFWLAQAAGRAMIEAGGGGRIIKLSSTRGVVGGRRGFSAYGASKAGVSFLVKQLATEWGQHGITVNAVAPGFVPTPMMAEAAADAPFMAMMRNRVPMGRFGTPIETAGVVLFLASPAASFVNGETIFVDGGVMASS